MTVEDKVILITGGSEGIGKVTAELLNTQGAKVAIAARSKEKLDEIAGGFRDGLAVEVDMTDPASITAMIDTVQKHYGRIDILINNAGRSVLAPVIDINIEDFKKIMELNVYGPLRAMQAVVPIMKAQGGGMIINISSNVSKMAIPMLGAYAATKYALNGLTLTARNELAPDGIVVSLMHPRATATAFGQNAIRISKVVFNRPTGMEADPPEAVAEKIVETITKQPAEQYMSKEIGQRYNTSA
jgi:NAD(P)-dependent dehydrogenase (short-subunit alcohol dehydrogenase family)